MRFVDLARAAALLAIPALLAGCPKKDTDAAPEPTSPAAAQAPVNDKAGAEPAAPAAAPAAVPAKKADDKGGW